MGKIERVEKNKPIDNTTHIPNELIIANLNDLKANNANIIRKTRLIPISAGTIETDETANSTELVIAINKNAITIVDGNVPNIPPIFVPNLSAIMVIITTTTADNRKGGIV